MHLSEHLKNTGQSQGGFGQTLSPPVTQGLVGQWLRGVTRITLHYALEIERATEGAVTPQDCSAMFIDPASRAAAAAVTHVAASH